MDRQFVCEPCGPHVAGGYDPETQQVIINTHIGTHIGTHY